MKTRLKTAVLLIAALGLLSVQAKADDIVYDNGPINGYNNAYGISSIFSVSDLFAVGAPLSLTSATVGLWTWPDASPLSLDWAIGTSVFGSEISSGTAALTNVFAGISSYPAGFSMFYSTFAISGVLTVGTAYYFTLHNAVSTDNLTVSWDINGGPSPAYMTYYGPDLVLPSHSYRLYGVYGESASPGTSGSSVPDASATIALLGGAVAGLALMRRRLAERISRQACP